MKKSQLEKVKLTDDEEQIKKLNTEKKNNYRILSQKIKNVETLNKISSALESQKNLLVILEKFN